jgi:hypothetical protein
MLSARNAGTASHRHTHTDKTHAHTHTHIEVLHILPPDAILSRLATPAANSATAYTHSAIAYTRESEREREREDHKLCDSIHTL